MTREITRGRRHRVPRPLPVELKDFEVVTLRQRVWDHRLGADSLALFLRYFNASPDVQEYRQAASRRCRPPSRRRASQLRGPARTRAQGSKTSPFLRRTTAGRLPPVVLRDDSRRIPQHLHAVVRPGSRLKTATSVPTDPTSSK